MRVKVEVTKRDIEQGDSEKCPIELALERLMGNGAYVRVGCGVVDFGISAALLCARAERFVERFDNDEDVKPFKFTLSIPSEFLKKPNHKPARKRKEKKP